MQEEHAKGTLVFRNGAIKLGHLEMVLVLLGELLPHGRHLGAVVAPRSVAAQGVICSEEVAMQEKWREQVDPHYFTNHWPFDTEAFQLLCVSTYTLPWRVLCAHAFHASLVCSSPVYLTRSPEAVTLAIHMVSTAQRCQLHRSSSSPLFVNSAKVGAYSMMTGPERLLIW